MTLSFSDFFGINVLEDLSYDTLFRYSEPKRVARSATVKGPPLEIVASKTSQIRVFNFKSFPSTTGLRHQGYILFRSPRGKVGKSVPLSSVPVEVDCMCPDYRYRWAWANKQRRAGRVGKNSLNQCINRAPRITNPSGSPGLCKHLLAARDYIYGNLMKIEAPSSLDGVDAINYKLDKLIKKATHRWINFDSEMEKAKNRDKKYKSGVQKRRILGPGSMVPDNIESIPIKSSKNKKSNPKTSAGIEGSVMPPKIPIKRKLKSESVFNNMKSIRVGSNVKKLVEEIEGSFKADSLDSINNQLSSDEQMSNDESALSILRDIRSSLEELNRTIKSSGVGSKSSFNNSNNDGGYDGMDGERLSPSLDGDDSIDTNDVDDDVDDDVDNDVYDDVDDNVNDDDIIGDDIDDSANDDDIGGEYNDGGYDSENDYPSRPKAGKRSGKK